MKTVVRLVYPRCALALLVAFAWSSGVFAAADQQELLAQQMKQLPNPAITTVQGRVFDTTTQAPIRAAIVVWSRGSQRHVGSTNIDGMFSFQIPTSERGRGEGKRYERAESGEVVLAVTANLFRGEKRRIHIHSGGTSRVDIGLKPKAANEIGAIQGRLTDENNGRPLANATVSILDAGAELVTTTSPEGYYRIGGVGFNRDLRISVTTRDPPCIKPVEERIVMDRPVLRMDIAATPLKLPVVHCPLNVTSPVGGGPTSLASDPNIHWLQADVLAIQINADADAWHAGHVNDIVRFDPGGGMLVATDTGGIWTITEISQPIIVSDPWGSTMSALALGPDDPRHVYAGTWPNGATQGGILMETDTSSAFPTLDWKPVNPKPPCGSINRILVIAESRRIVLACDSGLYWSNIPPKPSVAGTYVWNDATPANVQAGRNFAGLAKGPGWTPNGGEGSIVAAKWGGYAPGAAIYNGRWSGGTLQLSFSTVDQGPGNLFLYLGRTSVASCSGDPATMFGVAEDGNNNMVGVWKSTDGGAHWLQVSMPPNPGGQGGYNNAIAVSGDCRIVALGWEAGTFVSYDGGGSWNLLAGDGHLHGDVHALIFDPSDPASLFIGSDGGVASVSALGPDSSPAFRSNWNRQLFDLQLYHGAASSAANGLVASGLQDNGVVYAGLPGPWQHVTDCGCDGRWSIFMTPPDIGAGQSILLEEEWGAPDWPFSWVVANGNTISFNTQQSIPVSPSNPPVLTNVVTAPVRFPGGYLNGNGQPVLAAGGVGTSVYGMFGNNDGSSLHWEPLGQIGGGQNISAVSPTFNGQSIFVGTDNGNIYRLDAPFTGPVLQLTVNLPSGATGGSFVSGLAGFFPAIAYAALNIGGKGYVMAWDGTSWNAVGSNLPHNLPFGSIAAADLNTIFVATSAGVYDTHDGGKTWNQASDGLPGQFAAGNDLRIVTEPSGVTYLYLATFGRSLWRTQLP